MEPTAQEIILNLPGGPIRALSDGTLIRARGIRYATAARFHESRPLISWDESQDCTKPAPICPQNQSRLSAVNGDLEKGREHSEDCLRVTVVAPEGAENAPVMVFIHGGAWVSGGGDLDAYSPHKLVKKGGVVAVNITYRLGIFGYLPIPGIAPANLGLMDQIEALRWVQRNISSFGGDPNNVTVYGQSAGADSVQLLYMAAGTEKLFHRGIAQSPPTGLREDKWLEPTWKAMSAHAATIITPENAASLPTSELVGLTAQLLGVARQVAPGILGYSPLLGHHPLPAADNALEGIIATAREKQLVCGYAVNEDTAFLRMDTRPEASGLILDMFQRATEDMVQAITKGGGKKPAVYVVDWYPKTSEVFKATHCIDLPLILGDWESWKTAPMLQGPIVQQEVEIIGDSVKDLWISIARGADVSGQRFVIDKGFRYTHK